MSRISAHFTDVNDALLVLAYPDHPGWEDALHYLLRHAPDPLRAELHEARDRALKAAGIEFRCTGYLHDGRAVLSLAEVAEQLGITEAEVLRQAQALEARDGIRHLYGDADVQRVQ
jgi:AraC-like DNA-binding protein